jgi:hypothetical protein
MRSLVWLTFLGLAHQALNAHAQPPMGAGLALSPSVKYLAATPGKLADQGHVTVWQLLAGTSKKNAR